MTPPTAAVPQQGIYTVTIPDWIPTPLNRLMRNRYAAARLKKRDTRMVSFYALAVPCVALCKSEKVARKAVGISGPQKNDPEPCRRRVRLAIQLAPKQRGCDDDAFYKTVLDALVNCGLLVDDSRTWCEPVLPIVWSRGERMATTIVLEDI